MSFERFAICATLLIATILLLVNHPQVAANISTKNGNNVETEHQKSNDRDIPEVTKLIIDENKKFDDESLGEIVKDFGEHVGDDMTREMEQLFKYLEARESRKSSKGGSINNNDNKIDNNSKRQPLSKEVLERLKNANEAAARDIKTRIELAGKKDQSDMPQMSLGMKSVGNFVSKTQVKLQSAGNYIGSKISSLGGLVKGVPAKLRKMMHWPSFLNFKIKFNKNYKSLREELYRQMVYLHTQTKVGVQQIGFLLHREKSLLKATEFADITADEYHKTYHNPYAEAEARDSGPMLKPEVKAKLERLSSEGKNIFGLDIIPKTKKSDQHSRKRREADNMNIDELNEDSNDEFDVEEFSDSVETMKINGLGEDVGSELGDELVVDKYAAALDDEMDDEELDRLGHMMDDALESDKGKDEKSKAFTPVDLRDTGCVISPENQEGCGNCYSNAANAIAAYFECAAAKARGDFKDKMVKPPRFAPRFVSSCGRYITPEGERPLMNGCAGGLISAAIKYLSVVGAMKFMEYEWAQIYAGVHNKIPDECAYPRPKDDEAFAAMGKVKIDSFKDAELNTLDTPEEVALYLRTVGPAAVNIWTWKDFKLYGAGIYEGQEWSKKPILHSMVIVGHDRDQNGRDYWIILNSHGVAWGESGFVRIYWDTIEIYLKYYAAVMPTAEIAKVDALNG